MVPTESHLSEAVHKTPGVQVLSCHVGRKARGLAVYLKTVQKVLRLGVLT